MLFLLSSPPFHSSWPPRCLRLAHTHPRPRCPCRPRWPRRHRQHLSSRAVGPDSPSLFSGSSSPKSSTSSPPMTWSASGATPKLGKLSLGLDGKFIVSAAIGTREEDKQRLERLVKEEANAIVIDSSQGNSVYQLEMIKYAKRLYPNVDLIGGNIVTIAQAHNLIAAGGIAGQDGLWIDLHHSGGLRGGKRIDGRISDSGHIVKALTLGASTAMMGIFLAGNLEAPGVYVLKEMLDGLNKC